MKLSSGQLHEKPAAVRLPVEEISETEPNETMAMGEAGDHDVQAPTGLDREAEHPEGD